MAGHHAVVRAVVALACAILVEAKKVPGWEPSPQGKGFLDVESPFEFLFRCIKFCLAMSPFIIFFLLFCWWGRESDEEEAAKLASRKGGSSFTVNKKGFASKAA
eukprot:TRINITY_DN5948_c0_g1_i1.p1 TRINITY_DN5948_c0_g1~~TRINITY_DN5948_c0_g1_i1.p1  ORF type:complete len:104 (+),score=25.41 TRINITY_DN5948_c0_g1_i1:47-358(+)